ncbi:MAG: 2-polyprenyl-3-methyl-5-hydroxy-6-metoxy-1,4-benzoquinol methylase [Arcobacteraceae bacterium]|jgi:2-polyprenyl-3-methyl-5-hydroxy-6-metoxy-1,4-benzoquinol methylase
MINKIIKYTVPGITIDIYYKLSQKVDELNSNEILEFMINNEEIDYKAWVDLSHILFCKMLTPIIKDDDTIVMSFKKLNKKESFHEDTDDVEEKYGVESTFATINKNNQPSFLVHYLKALENVKVDTRIRILNLGVNSGEEFEILKKYSKNFENLELVGIDYCSSAIQEAKKNFDENNISFLVGDINKLEELNLGKFDLIISIGTLQSTNIDFNKAFMDIVQNYLNKDGAMILGFPNCRWIDGEMIYGAMVKNYNFSELSLVFKDVNYCKKYLQQKKFRVTVTGKDYIFLTATSIRK